MISPRSIPKGNLRYDRAHTQQQNGQEQHALGIASLAQFTQFKVYVKHMQDFSLIEDQIQQRCGQQPQIVYLHADLCRSDLLVEIEACHIQDSLS